MLKGIAQSASNTLKSKKENAGYGKFEDEAVDVSREKDLGRER